MTDEEKLEFETLKARVAELEARPSDPHAFEAAIKGSAMEKVARLELASLPPGWEDEVALRRATRVTLAVGAMVAIVTLAVFACHTLFGWPR